MAAPRELETLVERFDRNLASYQSDAYNEAQVREEFIDPMFELLGWDMRNRQDHAEAYKDVIHEDSIQIGGTTKAPDYCFRIGGTRKFFLEAKKPSVSIKDLPSPAYQLRRYAWSAKLPLSLLTDFQELAVYDCRVKPEKSDTPATARLNYLTCDQYPERWDEIAGVFSKDAVLKGSFDRFAVAAKGKRGTAAVDAAFLAEIERWRDLLARNIALRNPDLGIRELNEAVQRTIDRIIFLRICEDRGIETESQWQLRALENGANVYQRLFQFFERADHRYNSGLFHFQVELGFAESPDVLTPGLAIDDKVLKDIIGNLYYPESPYEFSVLPADILGQVYEQFLGKVIRLTDGHRAKVEDKPEVKKAGGVYYTPTYIVDYIVEHTVGELLKGKTPKDAAGLKIVDPACGSGSFLLGAYQRLLDWHRDWYVADGPEKHTKARKRGQPALYQAAGGEWRLTTAERKTILLHSIFGVDIDPQAVEVTKLSLLLKVLEGESEQGINQNLKLFQERALPDLADNIKCGNSLIGTDYNQGRQGELFDDEEALRVNAFDWDKGFPQIFARDNPGFDAVIGNPPYIRVQTLNEVSPQQVRYFKRTFHAASRGSFDIYALFVEQGLELLAPHGVLGFILPHKFFNAKYGEPLRSLVAEGQHLSEVVHFGDQQVFAGSTTYTCVLRLTRGPSESCRYVRVANLAEWRRVGTATAGDVSAAAITEAEWTFSIGKGAGLAQRLKEWPTKLGDVAARIFVGQQTSADPVFLFTRTEPGGAREFIRVWSDQLNGWREIEADILRPVVRSGSIGRYTATPTASVLFPYRVVNQQAELLLVRELRKNYPRAWEYLQENMTVLKDREKGKFRDEQWYRFGRSQNLGMWEQPKLLVPYMITRLSAFFDRSDNLYFINVTTGGYGITVDESQVSLEYLLVLLNSRLLDFALREVSSAFHGGYVPANKQFIERLPIVALEDANSSERARISDVCALGRRMQPLRARLLAARTDHEKTVLQRQIDATDREIDALVYELYGLTEDEVAMVEAAP
jgi:Eco57I restriction-modification methylase/TaqI-like C-terminal specificity domain